MTHVQCCCSSVQSSLGYSRTYTSTTTTRHTATTRTPLSPAGQPPHHTTPRHSTAQHSTRHMTHTTTTIMHPCCAPSSNKQPSFIHTFIIMSKGRRLVIKKSFRAAAEQQRSRIHSCRSVSRLTSHDAQFNTGYIYTEKM